jgi:hypothetical protein
MVDLDCDTGFGQHRDICGLNDEINHLTVSLCHETVSREMADSDKLGG